MNVIDIELDDELQRVLWACYAYWQAETLPMEQRAICYSWVVERYERSFQTRFHQSAMQRLTKLGFLEKADGSRGGNRRYYLIVAPESVGELLQKWNFKEKE